MEAHKLRFVRCPKCYQLLVEYPSITVYKCGGCGIVLRAKNRVVPAAQVRSESDEGNKASSSLKGSPQDDKLICSDEQKIASSVAQPCETTTDGIASSSINNTSSCEGANQDKALSTASSVTPVEDQKEETYPLVDGNIQNSGVMAKEIHESTGVGSSSNLTPKLENLDASENKNGGKVDNFGTNGVSTLHEKTGVVQKEERMHTYEGVHVESHEALIEELERSLSFSSEDEYFLDEAEKSGLSDALRHQMGSRRFLLGGKINDAPRSDPHGRLIEELEMSFSDAEETMKQHAAGADRVHGNELDKHLQNLGAESANPCEESISSIVNGLLKSEQSFHQENRLIDNGNQRKEDTENDNNLANYVLGNDHIAVANEDIAERCHDKEHIKDWLSVDTENVHPCEGSVSSVDGGNFKFKQSFQPNNQTLIVGGTQEKEESYMEGDNMINHAYGNRNVVFSDENIADRIHGNEEPAADCTGQNAEIHMEDGQTADCIHGNEIADAHVVETVDMNEHGKDRQSMESAHLNEGCISSFNSRHIKSEQSVQRKELTLTSDRALEKEEGCMEDGDMTNHVHVNEKLVFSDKDIAERVRADKESAADHTGKNEEGHMDDDKTASYVDENENVADTGDEDDHGKDQQSLEAENSQVFEGDISSFNVAHVKSEQNFLQNELIADGTEQKGKDAGEDGNIANSIQEDRAAVASFSSLSNKRIQCKLSSFNKNKDEMPYKYRASQLRQGLSLDAEDFKSIQNFIEPQMDGTSSSLSSGSPSQGDLVHRTSNKFNNIVRHERLKKMDELRDQLCRLSSQKGLEKKYQKRGLDYQQLSNDIEQHLQSVDIDSIPNSYALESYYGHGRPPRYQPPNPFSPTHTYPNYHFGHAQTCIPHNYDAWEFNSYYQSSYVESTVIDHDSLMSSYKEQKRVVRKHILRPLSGASPFSICSSCFNLVQMPADVYISKAKIGKMQCGQCSKVLVLSFAAGYHTEGKISKDVMQQSNKPVGSTIAKNKDATSHSAECLREPVNEEYEPSFTRSFSTQAGSSLVATQSGKKMSDSALHRLMGYDSASQLLRHSRVFDDGYDSFESMVPVSSRVSRRKNT